MEIENTLIFYSKNGAVYVYSEKHKSWYEIRKNSKLPIDINDQMKKFLKKAELIKNSLR
jgi:hypothetical protein